MDRQPPDLPIRHIVWDWNGTLLDDNHVMIAAVNAVCDAFGAPHIDMAAWQAAFCRPLWKCYGRILSRDLGPEGWPAVEKLFHDAYRKELAACRLAHDAITVLEAAKQRAFTQSILSMGLHHDVTAQVASFGITDYFTAVDGVKTQIAGGSKAEYLPEHVARLGLSPRACVIIGDVPDDAVAARRADVACVLFTGSSEGSSELHTMEVPVTRTLSAALHLLLDPDSFSASGPLARPEARPALMQARAE